MLRKLLRQAKTDTVILRRSRGLFAVAAPGAFELTTAMIDGDFPAYTAIMPSAIGNSATCQRADLLGALARLEAVTTGLVRVSWREGDTELRISLPKQPGIGSDTLAAKTTGSGSMSFDLPKLAPLITEFANAAVRLDITERALLIKQGEKTGVLASCRWQDAANDAAA
jgi:DNA polymerase III sliding clamp (beta) subunit (PCNA family)